MSAVSDADIVDLAVDDPSWLAELPELERLAGTAARLAFEAAGLEPAGRSVSVLACDDARIARLNRDFRGQDKPTNVLSWPAFPLAPMRPGGLPPAPPEPGPGGEERGGPDGAQSLGDVAIALQTARREAAALGIPLKDHVIHLILHGCLHLLGFDHEREEDAETMEGLESRALARVGIPDPYLRGDAE
jgi:probable rRNA maturation factor